MLRLPVLLLACAVSACGSVGIELLPYVAAGDGGTEEPPDAGPYEPPTADAATGDPNPADAGALPPNTPVVRPDAATADAAIAEDASIPADAGVPSDAGAPADAGPADAGVADAGDAGAPRDAGVADAGSDAGAPASCAGQRVFDLCWYLGATDQSCEQTCASRGGYDTRATSYVGTASQGGSHAECVAIMTALGRTQTVGEGMRSDDNGFGCHLWPGGDLWWLAQPSFRPTLSGAGVRIACGCVR